MYGFPLTIYLFSGWLQSHYPGTDWFSHDSGHLLETLFGWRANPHFGPFHILSFLLIGGGLALLACVADGKVSLIAGVTSDATHRIKAGELVNFVAQQVGGKGGGKPEMAMAGGSDPSGLGKALAAVDA